MESAVEKNLAKLEKKISVLLSFLSERNVFSESISLEECYEQLCREAQWIKLVFAVGKGKHMVIGTAIGLCACANQEDIDNAVLPVEQQVTIINTTLDDMKATDKTLNDSITALTGRVTVLEVELVEVNAKITSLQTDSATKEQLENVKTELQKQIDDLNDEIDELKNKDTDLKMQIDNLQDLLTVEIGNVKDWASNIFLSIENWNKAKVEIDDKISALRDRVNAIEDTLETMNTVISALQQQVEQKSRISQI